MIGADRCNSVCLRLSNCVLICATARRALGSIQRKQRDAAKANVRAVQTSVRYTTLEAPFDGTIGISQVKMGAAVSAGQTILNTVSSNDPMAADFPVSQSEIYRFTAMQQKVKKVTDSTFRLSFDTETYPYAGSIYLIDRAVDPQSGTIKTRLSFPNPKGLLKPGMSGTVKVWNDAAGTVMVPFSSVTEQLGEFFAYVVTGDKVTQRKILLGKQLSTYIIVKEGLKEGEVIVTQGMQKLREGSAVKIDTAKAASQAPAK